SGRAGSTGRRQIDYLNEIAAAGGMIETDNCQQMRADRQPGIGQAEIIRLWRLLSRIAIGGLVEGRGVGCVGRFDANGSRGVETCYFGTVQVGHKAIIEVVGKEEMGSRIERAGHVERAA